METMSKMKSGMLIDWAYGSKLQYDFSNGLLLRVVSLRNESNEK